MTDPVHAEQPEDVRAETSAGLPADVDVVVIGAGLAGLRAARRIATAGLDVVVLEKNASVGGRVASERVDGFTVDVGFQLLNPAYPALRSTVDLPGLDLRSFDPGVTVAGLDEPRTVLLPWRRPSGLGSLLGSGYAAPGSALALARWGWRALLPVDRLATAKDVPLADSWAAAGLEGPVVEEVLVPFLSGVLGQDPRTASTLFARLVLRSFLRAVPGVPAAGMAALAESVAASIRDRIRTGVFVGAISRQSGGWQVRSEHGIVQAHAVVVATDASAAAVLAGTTAPPLNGLSTWWFAADEAPTSSRLLIVDGRGASAGPIVNTAVVSNAAPTYAPPGSALIEASALRPKAGGPSEADVRRQLAELYGADVSGWQVIAHHDLPQALPRLAPPLTLQRPVEVGDGLFVAGDHRDTASIQGALVSGRRAGDAVVRWMRSPG